jgi:hypothetical protein
VSQPTLLCETSDDSYGVADWNPKMQDLTFRQGKDLKGPISVAVAGTVSDRAKATRRRARQQSRAKDVLWRSGPPLMAANSFLTFRQQPRPVYGFD